jgi:hypothetical protein
LVCSPPKNSAAGTSFTEDKGALGARFVGKLLNKVILGVCAKTRDLRREYTTPSKLLQKKKRHLFKAPFQALLVT